MEVGSRQFAPGFNAARDEARSALGEKRLILGRWCSKNRHLLFSAVYLIGVTFILFYLFSDWSYDDPFITYRYADNIRKGAGFVYNSGERIQSTSSPLFTVLLAVTGNFSSDIPRLANLIGSLSLALGALAMSSLARKWESPVVGWTTLFLYPTFPLLVSTLGSETPLYLALCLSAFAFSAYRRYNTTALCAALALLTRTDGVLVALLLGADHILHRRRIPWSAVIVFSGPVLAWFSFAWMYFGSPLPATLAAKQHQGLMFISEQFASGLATIASGYAAKGGYWLEALIAVLGLAFAAWRARQWMLFLLWPVIYAVAYSALGVSSYFWYYAPLVPGFVAAIGMGISVFEQHARANHRPPPNLHNGQAKQRLGAIARLEVGLIPGLGVFFLLFFLFIQGSDVLKMSQIPDGRIEIYRSIGQWLDANTPPGSTVGTLEAGIIGFYAGRRIVDFAGLLQPDVAAQLTAKTTYEDAAIWVVQHYHPNYIVLQEDVMPRLEENYIWYHCWPAQYFAGKQYHFPGDISVFFCK